MTTTQESRRASRGAVQRGGSGLATCKTCTPCRQKKVRCCGTRPRCVECCADELECVYPQDARREPRPSRARVRNLEAAMEAMLKHMKTSGIAPTDARFEDWISSGTGNSGSEGPQAPISNGLNRLASAAATISQNATASASTANVPEVNAEFLLSPPPSHVEPSEPASSLRLDNFEEIFYGPCQNQQPAATQDQQPDATQNQQPAATFTPDSHRAMGRTTNPQVPVEGNRDAESISGLSPGEARVAGVSHEHGRVSSVHGLASMMNQTSREGASNISTGALTDGAMLAVSKAHLISYAALQKQRESWIYRQPETTIDFDGCDPELAMHLIEVHFNQQHYVYLISYRPAIMDSLASGGGPWINKLLLNAIYYSSSLYSDRPSLQDDRNDQQKIGARFYDRFCQLLGSEIGKPSIPSAVALLLTSASLVSHGQSSAGWNLSGLAYRMVIDLGCHLTLGPDYQTQTNVDLSGRQTLNSDLDQEMRKRLYWGAYATDATQSLYLGRPCMFATVEARVPQCFLDTFEELEKWEPYRDPQTPSSHPPAYAPQPAHAVSTFGAFIRLFQISTRITKMYGIEAIKQNTQYMLEELSEIEKEFQNWTGSLPNHLRFDPQGSLIPPPHQVLPHTTFHALNILLHRAFLEDGHLCRHSDGNVKTRSEKACIQSALAIEKYVRAYQNTFTLRGAPFVLCYAIYSAVTVVLRQERHHRGHYLEIISFFWTCLSELQRGCNFGMTKPLAVLRDMVREYEISIKETAAAGTDDNDTILQNGLDESFFFQLPVNQDVSDPAPDSSNRMDHMDSSLGTSAPGLMWYLDDQERNIRQDTLYGLFTSSLPFG